MSRSIGVYRQLLLLYPRHFRREYGDELVRLFADELRDRRGAGSKRASLVFWTFILLDILKSAPREWYAGPRPMLIKRVPGALLGATTGFAVGSIVARRVVEEMISSSHAYLRNIDSALLIGAGVAAVFGLVGGIAGATAVLRRNSGILAMIVLTTVLGHLLFDMAFVTSHPKLPSAGLRNALWYGLPAAGLMLGGIPAVRRRPYAWMAMAIFAVVATVAARLWIDLVVGPYSAVNGLVAVGAGLVCGGLASKLKVFRKGFDTIIGLSIGLSFAWFVAIRAVPIWALDYRLHWVLPVSGALLGAIAGYVYWRLTRPVPTVSANRGQ